MFSAPTKRALAASALVVLVTGCSLLLDFSVQVDGGTDVEGNLCEALEGPSGNENPQNATQINAGEYTAALCGQDDDFFSFALSGQQELELAFSALSSAERVQADLFSSTDLINPISQGGVGNKTITRTVGSGGILPQGDYFLRVYSPDGLGEDTVSYRLNLTITDSIDGDAGTGDL